jgi:hypothetical protein
VKLLFSPATTLIIVMPTFKLFGEIRSTVTLLQAFDKSTAFNDEHQTHCFHHFLLRLHQLPDSRDSEILQHKHLHVIKFFGGVF